jgi:hypothetical protein
MAASDDLEAAEHRLGVRFPNDYRAFVLERRRYHVLVKHIALHAVARCDWNADDTAVVIGETFFERPGALVFKRARKGLSNVIYEQIGSRFTRRGTLSHFVLREPEANPLSSDARTRLAERLAGAARACAACRSETRAGQICACGVTVTARDPAYVLSADEVAAARAAHPDVWRASALLGALKAAGHAVPGSPKQLLATADVLVTTAAGSLPAALLATWRASGMRIAIDERVVADVLATAA